MGPRSYHCITPAKHSAQHRVCHYYMLHEEKCHLILLFTFFFSLFALHTIHRYMCTCV